MRFTSRIRNVSVFAKFCAALSSLDSTAWCRLSSSDVRFTVIPEHGSQVWSVLKIASVFEPYTIESSRPDNVINIQVPIDALYQALRSAEGAISVSIRLTKKKDVPMLSLTIVVNPLGNQSRLLGGNSNANGPPTHPENEGTYNPDSLPDEPSQHETIITQDIPIRILEPDRVANLHEPQTPEPDVFIFLPPLAQIKNVSDRFSRLAAATKPNNMSGSGNASFLSSTGISGTAVTAGGGGRGGGGNGLTASSTTRLELSANMHGSFRVALRNDELSIASVWTGLAHPDLQPTQVGGGGENDDDDDDDRDGEELPSARMKRLGGERGEKEEGWAKVRIDARDWSRVLRVGRLGVRVVACFMNNMGLVLYVYFESGDHDGEETAMTYFVNSFSA